MDGIRHALYPAGLTRCFDSKMFSFLNLGMAGLLHRHILAHPLGLRPEVFRLTSCRRRNAERAGSCLEPDEHFSLVRLRRRLGLVSVMRAAAGSGARDTAAPGGAGPTSQQQAWLCLTNGMRMERVRS